MDETEIRYRYIKPIVKEAGAIALNYFNQRSQLKITLKGVQDFVSQADQDVEKFLRQQILAKFPTDGIFGEEYDVTNYNENSFLWVIDPIDGTTPFLAGMSHWCVSVALVYAGKIVAGFVYNPLENEMFQAKLNSGSFLNDKKLEISDDKLINEGLTGFGYTLKVNIDYYLEAQKELFKMGALVYRNGSGALMAVYCAAGRLIGYFEEHINSWDISAGLIICREAGLASNSFEKKDWIKKGGKILIARPSLYNQYKSILPWDVD